MFDALSSLIVIAVIALHFVLTNAKVSRACGSRKKMSHTLLECDVRLVLVIKSLYLG